MPYQAMLDELVRSVPIIRAALLLDSEGEIVVQSGQKDDRGRLIGAYQGIAVATVRRSSARYGSISYMLCRYTWGRVILRPLKDDYYFVLALPGDALPGQALFRSAAVQVRLNKEL